MTLTLHYHPLASYCWKALIALYENDTPFEGVIVNPGDAESYAAFTAIWPIAKFPVLVEGDSTVAEATVIIDYLDTFHPGPTRFLPTDRHADWRARMWDRVFDHYVHEPMQRIIADRIRPEGNSDPFGVKEAYAQLATSYALVDRHIGAGPWAMGADFSIVDCAAAPALSYARTLAPVRRPAQEPSRLSRPADRPARLRAGFGGGRTLVPVLSKRGEAGDEAARCVTGRQPNRKERIMTASKSETARALFAAFWAEDRAAAERLLADDFTFTSPYDDAIDRTAYFDRCWPTREAFDDHLLEEVAETGNRVFVRYLGRFRDGKEFRNVEVLTVENGQVTKVEVYFGAAYRDGAFVALA